MNGIGERIKQRRKELGLTINDLAQRTGLSTGNISDLENNRYKPSALALIELVKHMGISADYILFGHDFQISDTAVVLSTEKHDKSIPLDRSDLQMNEIEKEIILQFRNGLGDKPGDLLGEISNLSSLEKEMLLKFRALDCDFKDEIYEYINMRYRISLKKKVRESEVVKG